MKKGFSEDLLVMMAVLGIIVIVLLILASIQQHQNELANKTLSIERDKAYTMPLPQEHHEEGTAGVYLGAS
jgi:Na+-transporting methylmalonyl-CoA/oxaloacetate decarboxylase gamma subunit